jgi:hypothetical protein
MRKILVLLSAVSTLLFNTPVLAADAAVVKTTITITPASYVFAGVPNPIDVAVCPKSSLNATECLTDSPERSVTLWANGRKIQTQRTVGGGGAATFTWTPTSSGSTSLKVTVAAGSGLKALTSEIKKVTVRAKTKASSLGTIACGTVCVQGIPDRLDLNIDEVITAGLVSGVVKGRKIRFQTLRTTNIYRDEISGTSSWQSDMGRYGYALSFSDIGSLADCTPGETRSWNFRFYADATSKSPAAATKAKWIDIVCPTGSGSPEDIQVTVDYGDQSIDYDNYYPDEISVSVTAPDSSQYSIYSVYCLKSDDCSNYDAWQVMDGYSKEDNIFGSQDFQLSADPGDYGNYWIRVEVLPWTDQDTIISDWYSLELNSTN